MQKIRETLIVENFAFDFIAVEEDEYVDEIKAYFDQYPPEKFMTKLESTKDLPDGKLLLIFQREIS